MSNEKHKKVQVVTLAKENQEYFLLLLQMNEDRNLLWQNVTGSVDPGEDFLVAAKRELKEETGLSSELIELPLSFEFHDRWGKDVLEKVYLAILPSIENEISLDAKEHCNFKWINTKNISIDNYAHPTNFESFQKALEKIC
jgi:ADP-ribose pyrophosphatase YjhB (NUDIX family)